MMPWQGTKADGFLPEEQRSTNATGDIRRMVVSCFRPCIDS